MRLKIGTIYKFNYVSEFDLPKTVQYIPAQLNEQARKDLVQSIDADEVLQWFQDRKKELANYLELLGELNEMIDARQGQPYSRRSAEEKKLQTKVETLKKKLFPKAKKTSELMQACNTFIRYYSPDKLQDVGTGQIEALYAGQTITPRGHTLHKWFCLSGGKVPEQYFNKKYMVETSE